MQSHPSPRADGRVQLFSCISFHALHSCNMRLLYMNAKLAHLEFSLVSHVLASSNERWTKQFHVHDLMILTLSLHRLLSAPVAPLQS